MRLVSAMLALIMVFGVVSVSFIETAAASGYYQTNKENVPVWSMPQSTSPSRQLRTIAAKGTVVIVVSTAPGISGRIWAKLNTGEYIFFGSSGDPGNLTPHTHTYSGGQTTYTYTKKSNTQHTITTYITAVKCTGIGCGYVKSNATTTTTNESHSFSGNTCTKCGEIKVPSTAGTYITNADNIPVRTATSGSASVIRFLAKNKCVTVTSVVVNDAGNYWGVVGSGQYIYMGGLNPHSHTLSGGQTTYTYTKKSNTQHEKAAYTSQVKCTVCDYVEAPTLVKTLESHSFSGNTCTKCGEVKVPSTAGTYITNADNIPVRTATSGSASVIRFLAKNKCVTVTSVVVNDAGNYWGVVGSGQYIYMGGLNPHSHTLSGGQTTYTYTKGTADLIKPTRTGKMV